QTNLANLQKNCKIELNSSNKNNEKKLAVPIPSPAAEPAIPASAPAVAQQSQFSNSQGKDICAQLNNITGHITDQKKWQFNNNKKTAFLTMDFVTLTKVAASLKENGILCAAPKQIQKSE